MSARPPAFAPASSSSVVALPPPGRRVTQRDIARQVGVSHVAVSLALRRDSRISPTLTRRIRDVAEKLGYSPDPTLLVLNNYRLTAKARPIRATLAWISPEIPSGEAVGDEAALRWQGAREIAEQNGYHLDPFGSDLRAGALQRVLDTRGIQGALLAPPPGGTETSFPALAWHRCPAVGLGRLPSGLRAHLVSGADAANAALAADRVHDRGYRRPGFVSTLRSARQTRFLAGFLQARALRAGDVDDPPPLLLRETGPVSDLQALDAWLERHRPDAILTDLPQLRGLLTQLGVAVPRDLALAALGVHGGAAEAGIDQNPREIGATACETLIGLIRQGARGLPAHPREILVGGAWVDGGSLPARSAPDALCSTPCPP